MFHHQDARLTARRPATLRRWFTNNHMQTNTETNFASMRGSFARTCSIFSFTSSGGSPQVSRDQLVLPPAPGRHLTIRQSKRRIRLLNRREEQFGSAYMNCLPLKSTVSPSNNRRQTWVNLPRLRNARYDQGTRRRLPVLWIAACDQVKQRTSVRETVKVAAWRAATVGEVTLGRRATRTSAVVSPGSSTPPPATHLHRSPRRDQHTGIAQTIRRLRNCCR